MQTRRLYINTIGCQMNVYDSEQIVRALVSIGYTQTSVLEEADLVIVNTCAIRAKAEQKAFSFVGRLAALKRLKPDLIVGVGGCVAQQEGELILSRTPHVDIVFGPHAISRLAGIVARVELRRERVVDVAQNESVAELEVGHGFQNDGQVARFVTIMQGCDNYCTYCVVPFVRGPEMSRRPEHILREIRAMVAHGVREVTLLGQNVNRYGAKEGSASFVELLEQIDGIEDLARIRFTTSHPKDLSGELIEAFGRLDRLCPHIHLPVQSGADRILARMNRRYTREIYLARLSELRRVRPDIAVTTDFIVGFPGETQTEFDRTLELIQEARFDGVFAFMYSDRRLAPAHRFKGRVAEAEKRDRLQRLLDCQETITLAKNQAFVGSVTEVLVEGLSSRPNLAEASGAGIQWTGRTPGNKIVNFSPDAARGTLTSPKAGDLTRVRIEGAYAHSLWGRPTTHNQSNGCAAGGTCHAA